MTGEPLPTVPESAPPLCTICGHPDLEPNGAPVHVDESVGDIEDGVCVMCARASAHLFSAPRPVPESATERGYHSAYAGTPPPEPPAPPAEPVEGDGMLSLLLDRFTKPVEEAQPFAMFTEAFEAGAFAPPVEAEDEGARPLATLEGATERLAVWVYRVCTGSDFYKDISETQRGFWREQARPHAAAIRKEATAALDWQRERADEYARQANEYMAQAAHHEARRDEWRTRAEAAEGARDLQRHDLEQEHRERLLWMDAAESAKVAIEATVVKARVRTHDVDNFPASYEISVAGYEALHEAHHAIEAARALTAESVTPTGESK